MPIYKVIWIVTTTCAVFSKILVNPQLDVDDLDGFERDFLLVKELLRMRVDGQTTFWTTATKDMLLRFMTSCSGSDQKREYVRLVSELLEQSLGSNSDWANHIFETKRFIMSCTDFKYRDEYVEYLNKLSKQNEPTTPEAFILQASVVAALQAMQHLVKVSSGKKTNYLARISKEKNLDTIIDAIPFLSKVSIEIVGRCSDEEYLGQLKIKTQRLLILMN